jgi:DNA mismatch repair protein MutL
MKIRILDQETILKIAAGEVIERPASVVRELLDNAVDAGASSIGIEVFEGGLDRIIISDDGEGMTPEELRLAVERHATSKIAGAQDLFNISTMGFRGEALASIGAVSRLAITTRTRDAVAGCRLEVRGGEKGAVEATSSPQGTRVEVEGLFYNTPARMKFLRTPATEFSAIAEVVHRQVLARPGIRFRLSHNGKLVLVSPGAGSLVDAIACVAGTDIAEGLLECNLALDGYTVTGYIAKPAFHRSNRAMQYFTVNGRPVNVRLMGSAVEKAFHTLLPVRRFPIAFLNLDLPGDQVDVNVHPAKLEVKFTDSSAIFRLVYRACLEALTAVTGATLPKKEEGHMVEPDDVPISRPAASPRPWSRPYTPQPQPRPGVREPQVEQLRLDTQTAEAEPEFSVLGQVFSSFIVVATPHELRLVDQHAAQERVLYEKFLGLLERGERPSQVVVPVEAPLSGRAYQFVQAQLHRLAELGFKLELTDTGMIIREVPILFKKVLSAEDIGEIIEYLQDSAAGEFDLTDYSQAALMLMACKGAIKANHRLSAAEARQLILELERCENSRTCPHGRPIWVSFDRVNLEKLFARR